jgi:hypothetical protein
MWGNPVDDDDVRGPKQQQKKNRRNDRGPAGISWIAPCVQRWMWQIITIHSELARLTIDSFVAGI